MLLNRQEVCDMQRRDILGHEKELVIRYTWVCIYRRCSVEMSSLNGIMNNQWEFVLVLMGLVTYIPCAVPSTVSNIIEYGSVEIPSPKILNVASDPSSISCVDGSRLITIPAE